MTRSFPPVRWRALEGAKFDGGPARTCEPAPQAPARDRPDDSCRPGQPRTGTLLSPLSQVRVFGSGDHPLVADVGTGTLSVCGRRGAPAFCGRSPKRGMGGASG